MYSTQKLSCISTLFFCFPLFVEANRSKHPNVIFILADDIGYQDFGCYGAKKIDTPNIDKLAREGVKFTNAHSPASTSSPSRYALLTGEYAWRKNVGILPADAPLTIDTNKETLPSLFKANGFQTAIIGKWHLGLGEKGKAVNFNDNILSGPLAIGFDYAYYFPATNDRVPCIYIENEKVDNLNPNDPITVSYRKKIGNLPTGKNNPNMLILKPHLGHDGTIINGISRIGWMSGGEEALWKDQKMTDQLLQKTKTYIRNRKKDKPFFLYYAPQNAHEPRVPSKEFLGKSKAGIYGDVIEEFDYCIGELIKTLKKEGIYENTIIIISSDNGPMIKEGYKDGALENINEHNPYANLRGQKYSLYEGGTRVPFIFSWPAEIKRSFVQKQCFSYLDMLATFSHMLKLDMVAEDYKDSKNGSALFFDPHAPSYREYILTQNNSGQVAIRQNGWKFIPNALNRGAELYHLDTDPSELRDLMNAYPEKARTFREHTKKLYKK